MHGGRWAVGSSLRDICSGRFWAVVLLMLAQGHVLTTGPSCDVNYLGLGFGGLGMWVGGV